MSVSKIETNPSDISGVFELLRESFSYMADRIDPPSSLTRMSAGDVAAKAALEDLFVIRAGGLPIACLFGSPLGPIYYVGKLAVARAHRGQGLARALMEAAADHARAAGQRELQLQSRVELVENHAAFKALGFTQCGTTTHEGFSQPTSLTFRRPL